MNQNQKRLFVLVIALFAILLRFGYLPFNFQAMGAMAIVCGCLLRGWFAWLVPAGVMAVSDVLGEWLGVPSMGFYDTKSTILNYSGYVAAFGVGRAMPGAMQTLRNLFERLAKVSKAESTNQDSSKARSASQWLAFGMVTAVGAVSGSLLYFLFSNFGAWLNPIMGYPQTPSGLWTCYVKGIPFYRATLQSDLLFTPLFLGAYLLVSRLSMRERLQPLAVFSSR